jgi:hypothetical protein
LCAVSKIYFDVFTDEHIWELCVKKINTLWFKLISKEAFSNKWRKFLLFIVRYGVVVTCNQCNNKVLLRYCQSLVPIKECSICKTINVDDVRSKKIFVDVSASFPSACTDFYDENLFNPNIITSKIVTCMTITIISRFNFVHKCHLIFDDFCSSVSFKYENIDFKKDIGVYRKCSKIYLIDILQTLYELSICTESIFSYRITIDV